ncbi:MAG: UDP-N-acetylmuramate:L-alanyl-gamma-D-glutamyl-meso-diaminopimelate ligase [Pseudomonadota bacterium]
MHLHILGIAGTFMGGLAQLARAAGHEVTGADAAVYPPMSDQLTAAGIPLHEGWDPAQLEPAPDVVVIGNALSRGNPVVEAVLDRGIPYTSGPQWLAEQVLAGRHVIAVAGTHGKTTTASLVAALLEAAGEAPGFLIGGVPGDFGVSARLGEGRCFVVEADEYDTAFFDKRSKFLHYRPRTLVLNNLEFDHADIFADLADIQRQFHHLVRTVPGTGAILAPAADPAIDAVLEQGCWTPVTRAGPGGDWEAGGHGTHLTLARQGQTVVDTEWPLTGEHNRANAAMAVAAVAAAGVEPATAASALAGFAGVRRRQELRGEPRGIRLLDDFAHHPTAIRTTLAGLREERPEGRLWVVTEPRSATMRRGVHRDALAGALAAADGVFALRPEGLEWDLAEALAPLGERARIADELEPLVAGVAAVATPGDTVVVMSNGGFGGIHERLLTALGEAP